MGQLMITAFDDIDINFGKMTAQQHSQLNNLVIPVGSDQALIDEMLFQTGQDIFKGGMQDLNQVKAQGFCTFQLRNFQ